MLSRSSNWFFLLVLIYFLLVSGLPVKAQAPTKNGSTFQSNEQIKKTLVESMKKNPWSDIKGFRSARFGMNEKSVYGAIARNFKIAKSKIRKSINNSEKTTTLQVTVPNLFATGGTAKVGYIFGYKSKKLIHINVLWGEGAAEKAGRPSVIDSVVEMANLLRVHFMKKRYKEKTVIVNGMVDDTTNIVFRGRDKKKRMIVLVLDNPASEGVSIEESSKKISLVLSYLENPDEPDVRKISIKGDQF